MTILKSPKPRNRVALLWQFLIGMALLTGYPLSSAGADQSPDMSLTPGVTLGMTLAKPRLYLGESTAISVFLKLRDTSIRNIGYPVLTAPGVTVGEFTSPRIKENQEDGATITIYEFSASVTPRRSGVIRLGPARIDGEILVPATWAAGFYGESTATKASYSAPALDLTVLPLPIVGRPPDFSGAVGRFTLAVTARPTSLQIGDPVTVSTVITGVGNLDNTMCPENKLSGFKTYPAQASYTPNGLRCEQVVVPEGKSAVALPQARFSYFDPAGSRYHTLQGPAIALDLIARPGIDPQKVDSALPRPVPPRGKLSWSWLWLLLPLPVAAGTLLLCRKRPVRDRAPAVIAEYPGRSDTHLLLQAAHQALVCDDVEEFYNAVFRVSEKLLRELALKSMAGHKIASAALDDHNGDKRVVEKMHELDEIVTLCDAVRYGCRLPGKHEMQNLFARLNNTLKS